MANVTLNMPCDLLHQSKRVSEREDIRTATWGIPKGAEFLETVDPTVNTVYDMFLRGKNESKNGPCLGVRQSKNSPYQWRSYDYVAKELLDLGSGFVALGNQIGQSTFIGVYAANCPEFAITDLATQAYSMIVVPLYDTLGAEAVSHIILSTEMQTVVCDTAEKCKSLLDNKASLPSLKSIIVIQKDGFDDDLKKRGEENGVRIVTYLDALEMGREHPVEKSPSTADDIYIFCYTSGTTGLPKGVMLTQRGLVAQISALYYFLKDVCGIEIGPSDTTISYLPLAHMFEQLVHSMSLFAGSKIGYFSGDIRNLMSDMKELKPTFFPSVPRLLNRVTDQINGKIQNSNWLIRKLFKWGYDSKLESIRQGIYRKDTIWDSLFFGRVQSEMGGHIRAIVTGSAPITEEVLTLSRIAMGCPIFEGYGQTECVGACTISLPGDITAGHVGAPLACCHIKLVDSPELNYYAVNEQGEICVKGPIVMKGYFKDVEKTQEALDEDGWLHTGDIGVWLPNGTLKVIDRKKHIFKLAQGEYVAPEKIEGVYMRMPEVMQIFVDGLSVERHLVAIVIPDPHQIKHVTQTQGSLETLCQNPEVKKEFLKKMTEFGNENGLNSIESVKAIELVSDPFSVENGLLTPTFKNKRPQLRKHFAETIENLYKKK